MPRVTLRAPNFPSMADTLHYSKIELPPIDIDMCYLHPNQVAQPIAIAAAMAGQTVRGAVVSIKIVVQRIDVNQPLRRQLDALREQAEILHARDHRVHRLADPLSQVAEQLHLDQLALRRLRP